MKEYEDFLVKLEMDKSQNTIRAYKYSIELFLSHFQIETCEDIEKLSIRDFDKYQKHLLKTLSASSVNSRVRPVKAFINYLITYEYITKNPCQRLPELDTKSRLPVVLSDSEKEKMFKACKNDQERLLIAFLLTICPRREEICNLLVENIVDGQYIRIIGKGDKERELPLNKDVQDMLAKYLINHKSKYIFTAKKSDKKITPLAVYLRVKSIVKRAGLSPEREEAITTHKFRHTVATDLAQKYPTSLVQQWMGHESEETTRRYIHIQDQMLKKIAASQTII